MMWRAARRPRAARFCRKLKRMDSNTAARLRRVSGKHTLTLTHYGRKTGQPHQVTIWFVFDGQHMYLATANVNRQWVKNVIKTRFGGEGSISRIAEMNVKFARFAVASR